MALILVLSRRRGPYYPNRRHYFPKRALVDQNQNRSIQKGLESVGLDLHRSLSQLDLMMITLVRGWMYPFQAGHPSTRGLGREPQELYFQLVMRFLLTPHLIFQV